MRFPNRARGALFTVRQAVVSSTASGQSTQSSGEFDEEYALAVRVGPLLGVLESILPFGGDILHSVMFVYVAELVDPAAYGFERMTSRDAPHISAVWRPVNGSSTEFMPPGIEDLIT